MTPTQPTKGRFLLTIRDLDTERQEIMMWNMESSPEYMIERLRRLFVSLCTPLPTQDLPNVVTDK
jgi:hypothetical protein